MFDAIDSRIFWPLFVLVVFAVSYLLGRGILAVIRWCDTPSNRYVHHNPLTRDERKHLRSVTNGKRAMASDR